MRRRRPCWHGGPLTTFGKGCSLLLNFLQLRAVSEALLTAVAGSQPGGAPSPARDPAAYLEALLGRLAGLNRDGYFENPVDEDEAPGWVFTFFPRKLIEHVPGDAALSADGLDHDGYFENPVDQEEECSVC